MASIRSSMKIEGLNELRKALQRLPVAVQEKVLPNAVAKGAAVIRDEAKKLAPVLKVPDARRTPGLLKRMIRSTRGVRRSTEASAFVSVRRLVGKALGKFKEKTGKAAGLGDPWYWRFIEFGTSKMRAIPFIRPAFDTKKTEAVRAIADELRDGIAREAPQAGGRRF